MRKNVCGNVAHICLPSQHSKNSSLQVRGSVIQSLSSVEIDDLPVIVRFLLQTIDGKEAVQVGSLIFVVCRFYAIVHWS